MRNYLFHLLSALFALILSFLACNSGDDAVAVASVTVKRELTLSVNGRETPAVKATEKLIPNISPANAANKEVAWSSDAPAVASVANDGTVTTGLNLGEANIKVTTADGGKTDTCVVTVIIPVTSVSLNYVDIMLLQGQPFTLTETVSPPDATKKAVTWISDHPEIADVSSSGIVTAISEGQAVITATSSQDATVKAICAVTVQPIIPVTGITLNETELALSLNQTAQLEAEVLPGNATSKALDWSSSDKTIADVSQTGKVTALALGTATITAASAAYPAIYKECAVTVSPIVYVSGLQYPDTGAEITLWTDGVPQKLDGSDSFIADASSVFVLNSNVYVAGYMRVGSLYVPRLWINGEGQTLPANGGRNGFATSVFVSGGNVYVAGYDRNDANNRYVGVVWKNGVREPITDGTLNAYPNSIFVSGNDVYASGREGSPSTAKVWKNGAAQNLTDGTTNAYAQSIYVAGGDVYVAGYVTNPQGTSVATVWKNGSVFQTLSDGARDAYGFHLFVSGDNVYVAGVDTNAQGQSFAALWVNGAKQILGDEASYASSVFVVGDNVYVAGYVTNPQGTSVATLWVNGVPQALGDGTIDSEAQSVFAAGN